MGIPLGNHTAVLIICAFGLSLVFDRPVQAQTVESTPFRAILSPRNQVPPVALQAGGAATVWLRVVRNADGAISSASLDLELSYQFPGAVRLTGLNFRRGIPGTNGELVLDAGMANTADTSGRAGFRQRLNLAANRAEALLSLPRTIYLNLETADFPNGALRGQLEPADQALLLAPLAPTGIASVHLLATRDPRGRLTSAQISLQADAPNPYRMAEFRWGAQTIGVPAPAGRFEVALNQPNADLVTALLSTPQEVTLTLLGADERLTGRLHGTDRATFFPRLPDAAVTALSVYALRNETGQAVAAHLVIDPPPGNRTGTVALAAIFEASLDAGAPFTRVNVVETGGLAAVNRLLRGPESFALQWGTERTSALGGAAERPVAQAVISAVWDPRQRRIAPGGLFTVFGNHLVAVPGDLSGLLGNRAPTAMNGTSVWLAGRMVPLLDVRADRVIAQAPLDTPLGNQPLLVRTAQGDSAPVLAEVAVVAPAVFFGANSRQGNIAVVYKANGTEVSMENPARPNDVLLFFSTGFGARLTPGLAEGVAAPANPLVRTVNPVVTIGGRGAAVIYSVMAPGLVGIVQTAVRMPQNAGSGDVPLTVSLGEVRAEPVRLFAALR